MRYIIDVSQAQVRRIESLIEEHRYESINQFISVAIENQLHIEKDEMTYELKSNNKKYLITKKYHDQGGFPSEVIDLTLSVPEESPIFAPQPTFSQLVCIKEGLPEEQCWMWGQTNKIFPIKIALRFLLRKIGSGEWTALDKFKEESAKLALEFGKVIILYEEERNIKREDRISHGLPRNSEDSSGEFKSLTRYKSHFIGNLRRDGKLDGAMMFLRFANIVKDDKGGDLIGITKSGYEFACIENPVIDLNKYEQSLSNLEANYYFDHIYRNIPGEFSAFKWLLSKIDGGIVERTELNYELKKEFGSLWEKSEAVINTQRAGLMSRMFELGLIDKKKKGIHVEYLVSEKGKNFLKKYEA